MIQVLEYLPSKTILLFRNCIKIERGCTLGGQINCEFTFYLSTHGFGIKLNIIRGNQANHPLLSIPSCFFFNILFQNRNIHVHLTTLFHHTLLRYFQHNFLHVSRLESIHNSKGYGRVEKFYGLKNSRKYYLRMRCKIS